MKKFKRAIAALLVFLMVMQPAAFAASVTDFFDFPQDWSKDAMTAAVENGLYIGNENKLIQPGKALTRAELAAFVTRAFGATRKADISMLTDVSADDWFYEEVAKAYQMGAVTGTSDTTFSPNAYITREQVFLALARILCISGTDESVLDRFTDASDISDWAKNGIIGLVQNGYIDGYPDGSFRPQRNITRAELAQLFFNIFKTYIDNAGYYSGNMVASEGSIMVRVPGVHLENATVNGDVVIADGVADGNFNITTVTVNGRVLARGGEGWVTFKDVTMNGSVVVYDNNGTVNFYNYRTDAPFKNLEELTPATFLTKPVNGGTTGGTVSGGSSSGVKYYYVRFYDGDGDLWDSQKVRSGKYADEPANFPEKDGYTFLYWSTEKKTTGVERPEFAFASTAIKKTVNLYPVYAKNPVVTFYDADGSTVLDTVTVKYNKKVSEPTDPTKDGYTFKHWSLTKDGETAFDFDTLLKSDINLYAVFTANPVDKITVTFVATGATNVPAAQLIEKGTTATEPTEIPIKSGYTFKHWSLTADGAAFDFATTLDADTTLYAVFTKNPEILKVNFYTDPDTLDTTVEVEYNQVIDSADVPAPATEDGYVLDETVSEIYKDAPYKRDHSVEWGWWTISGGKWVEYDPTKPVTEDINVYQNSKNLKLSVIMPKAIYDSEVPLSMIYNDSVRAMDTLKDALDVNKPVAHNALDSMEAKFLAKLEGRVIDNATDKNILNIHRHVKIVDVLGETNIRTIISKVVDDSVDRSDAESYIALYLSEYADKTAAEQTKAVDEITGAIELVLAGSGAEAFKSAVRPIMNELLGTDVTLAAGSVDKTVVRTFLEKLALPENNAKRGEFTAALYAPMTTDALMDVSGALGQSTAADRTAAVEQFIDQLCHEDKADVSADNLFLYEPIYDMLKTHGWDFFEAKLPDRVKEILPTAKLKELYDRHYTPYLNAMKAAMDGAESGIDGSIDTGLTIELNPVSDLMIPMFDFVKDIKARAEAKADASTKEKIERFYPYYKNNKFIAEYETFLTADKWLNGSDNGYAAELSGYSLKDFSDYYDILFALTAISDDAMQWFYDETNVPLADRDAVLDAAGDYLLDAANIINNHVIDFAFNGIPTDLKDLCTRIETDPDLLAYLKKFGVDAYLTKLEDNATAGKVYATAEEKVYARFGARIEALLDKYASSKLNRTYTDEDYDKVKELLYGLFTDESADIYSVDVIFDEYLNKYFDKFMDNEDSISFEKGEDGDTNHIKLSIQREMFYSVADALKSTD